MLSRASKNCVMLCFQSNLGQPWPPGHLLRHPMLFYKQYKMRCCLWPNPTSDQRKDRMNLEVQSFIVPNQLARSEQLLKAHRLSTSSSARTTSRHSMLCCVMLRYSTAPSAFGISTSKHHSCTSMPQLNTRLSRGLVHPLSYIHQGGIAQL